MRRRTVRRHARQSLPFAQTPVDLQGQSCSGARSRAQRPSDRHSAWRATNSSGLPAKRHPARARRKSSRRDEAFWISCREVSGYRSRTASAETRMPRIRHQCAVVPPPRPLREAIVVCGKGRREDMAENRILENPPLLVRKFMVQPIIGERNGNSDLSAIQKGLDTGRAFQLGSALSCANAVAWRTAHRLWLPSLMSDKNDTWISCRAWRLILRGADTAWPAQVRYRTMMHAGGQ